MKRELGWFRTGSGVILSLLFLMVVPACSRPFIEVTVGAKCESEEQDNNKLPKGGKTPSCNRNGNNCEPDPDPCICRK